MRVGNTEEMIMNEKSPAYGMRRFRLEYGGHAENCKFEGTVYLPNTADVYDRIEEICSIIKGDIY